MVNISDNIAYAIDNLISLKINGSSSEKIYKAKARLSEYVNQAVEEGALNRSEGPVAICKVYKGKEKDNNGEITYSRAKLPYKKYSTSSGFDAYACYPDQKNDKYIDDTVTIEPGETKIIPLGINVLIPEGYEIQCRPRSGASLNCIVTILGTIDEEYRGVLKAIVHNTSLTKPIVIKQGERICQLVVAQRVNSVMDWAPEGEEIPSSERGSGGFGSTGKF